MTDKQIMIDGVDVSGCGRFYDGSCRIAHNFYRCTSMPDCHYKKWKRKEQECERMRKYHNKCCEEFEKEKKEWLEKYNQVSRDFCSGKYCNAEKCQQLDQLEAENEELKKKVYKYEQAEKYPAAFLWQEGLL